MMRNAMRAFRSLLPAGHVAPTPTGTPYAVPQENPMSGPDHADLDAQERALEERLRMLEGRLERTTQPTEAEELLREHSVLTRRLEAVRRVQRNRESQQRAVHDAAARAEETAARRRRREAIEARLAAITTERAALLAEARAERPDLSSDLAWELPEVRRLGAEQTGLQRELVAVHQALDALATEEVIHAV